MANTIRLFLSLFLVLQACNPGPRSMKRHEIQEVGFISESIHTTLFNNKVIQDSLFAYVNMYKEPPLNDSIPQVFCVYVYLDRQNDTIIDFSNSIAFRVDLKEMFGIYTKGETSFSGERVIVRYRSIDSFSAINESALQESNADYENIFTRNPDLMVQLTPAALKPTSRVYKLISQDSLQLLSRISLVPTYDNPSYDDMPISY